MIRLAYKNELLSERLKMHDKDMLALLYLFLRKNCSKAAKVTLSCLGKAAINYIWLS